MGSQLLPRLELIRNRFVPLLELEQSTRGGSIWFDIARIAIFPSGETRRRARWRKQRLQVLSSATGVKNENS